MAKQAKKKARQPPRRERPPKDRKPKDLFGRDVVRLLSLRQYATSRNVVLKSVQKAIDSGRITVEENGKINPELADAQWKANTDTRRQPIDGEYGGNSNASGNNSDQLKNARMVRAIYEAKLVEMDYKQKSRSLVEKTAVYREQFAAARVLRDTLLTIGDRVAPLILGKSNITEIAEAMNAEVRRALREFADRMDNEKDADSTTTE